MRTPIWTASLTVAALSWAGVVWGAEGSFPVEVGGHFADCAGCPEMVVVPAGRFLMGSPASERHRFDNEGPQHPVTVARPFAIGRYPITAGEYARWTGAPVAADEARLPAVGVTWDDANRYAAWLSARTGRRYRLPTEAEYEYAERAGTTTPYYWGYGIGADNANCDGCGSPVDGTGATPVGSFRPNAFGVYDMAGDVFEWVADCYADTYDGAPTDAEVARQSPGGGACAMRGLRGSSWFNLPSFLRSAYRFRENPVAKSARRGFRLVREADAPG